jgi:hypothetical protein
MEGNLLMKNEKDSDFGQPITYFGKSPKMIGSKRSE